MDDDRDYMLTPVGREEVSAKEKGRSNKDQSELIRNNQIPSR